MSNPPEPRLDAKSRRATMKRERKDAEVERKRERKEAKKLAKQQSMKSIPPMSIEEQAGTGANRPASRITKSGARTRVLVKLKFAWRLFRYRLSRKKQSSHNRVLPMLSSTEPHQQRADLKHDKLAESPLIAQSPQETPAHIVTANPVPLVPNNDRRRYTGPLPFFGSGGPEMPPHEILEVDSDSTLSPASSTEDAPSLAHENLTSPQHDPRDISSADSWELDSTMSRRRANALDDHSRPGSHTSLTESARSSAHTSIMSPVDLTSPNAAGSVRENASIRSIREE